MEQGRNKRDNKQQILRVYFTLGFCAEGTERKEYIMRKFNITVNGNTYEVDVEEVGGVQTAAAPAAAPVQKAAPALKAAPAPKKAAVAGAKTVKSPMPGTIVSVKVNVGDTVKADTLVAVLEAMKMENEIFAGVEGTVAGVSISAGDSVNSGDVIISVN